MQVFVQNNYIAFQIRSEQTSSRVARTNMAHDKKRTAMLHYDVTVWDVLKARLRRVGLVAELGVVRKL